MNKGTALVGGVGLGAALMYFFDPDRGKRRRAKVRHKVETAGDKVGTYAEKMSRDIKNRAYGIVTETTALFKHEDVTDDVLVDRVRAKLGRYPDQLDAIDIQATRGAVILTGSIQANELPKLLRAARFVRGVKRVENQLRVLPAPEGVPEFQSTPQPLAGEG